MAPTKITATDIPATLNGYPVKGFSLHPNCETALVLIHRADDHMSWVAATWAPACADEWMWGNYFRSYQEADEYRGRWIAEKARAFARTEQEAN